ncbi:pyruvate formate lyase family protein [Lacrimispora aerotolerans]|uniref:pyruvate formate lyase family protein n=1 Tax=Lacrimispora aerotolerans TaxID=36832 RepID=UPI00047EB064|nr:pyruvate formate lyase family protein [Lacrimispora aerotolerans]
MNKLLEYEHLIYDRARGMKKINRNKSKIALVINAIFSSRVILEKRTKKEQLLLMLKEIKLMWNETRYYYYIDEDLILSHNDKLLGNMPIDYSKCSYWSIADLRKYHQSLDNDKYDDLLDAIEIYIKKIADYIFTFQTSKSNYLANRILKILTHRASDLEDSFQRILIWNSLFHQSGHTLMGLGRLDKILNEIINDSVNNEDTEVIKDFLIILHNHYEYKSQELLGDTGQLIILGGLEENGEYFCNWLTYEFIKVVINLNLPDPKLMLRVCEKTPIDLLELAVRCMITGNGSPIISNDDVVIPKMIEFGYANEDAYNYCVSACWEPLVPGKTLDQNNLININFVEPLKKTMDMAKTFHSYEQFLDFYLEQLKVYSMDIVSQIESIKWSEDPLLSMFFTECVKSKVDIAFGGAKYNNYGLLTIGLASTVNSLINIKKYVFINKELTISQLNEAIKNNYINDNEIRKRLMNIRPYFGTDNEEVIELTNRIFNTVKTVISVKINYLGGRYKVGLSSPSYLTGGKEIGATCDGRKAGDAFATHISASQTTAFTEIMSFASKIDYGNGGFNGNVVDIISTPDFMNKNFDKFIIFLQIAIKQGFFQMQMNIVSSNTLIDAKNNPDKFPDLIVRVWGFSAFFSDLPEEYKDILIKRALENESIYDR